MNYLLLITCVLLMLMMGEGLHQSLFDGLQEIVLSASVFSLATCAGCSENTHISHQLIHRTRRHVFKRKSSIPDTILTEIKGDNHQSNLKFHRNRKKTLSPLFTLNKDARIVEKMTETHCTHFYEDIENSAHAIVERCNGTTFVRMVAEVALNNEVYMILPKNKQSMDQGLQHGLFKVNTTTDYSKDYIMSKEQRQETESSLPNINHRFKRQTEAANVELMIVIDFSLYSFWYSMTTGTDMEREAAALDMIQKMYAFFVNGINLRYKRLLATYGINIGVELTSVYVLMTAEESAMTENADDSIFPRGVVDTNTLLDNFKTWVSDKKVSSRDTTFDADHFMLLTGREIVQGGNADAAGFAFTSAICSPDSVSVAEDKFDFLSVVTAAHELGHSLGGIHDRDTGNPNCLDDFGFILASINEVYRDSRATHPWSFSPCSAEAFNATLEKSSSDCLRRDDTRSSILPTGKPPGQVFPPDKQCQLVFGSDSVMWRQMHANAFDRICTAMACTQLQLTQIRFMIPGDGTTCGNKKWCWDSQCVFSEDAPAANESCIHGDQTGSFLSGSTCTAELAGDNIWRCYLRNVEEPCCATCAAAETNIEGCKYGDSSDCSQISASRCYQGSVAEEQCCQTCYNFAQPYVNLPAACKYGDRMGGCVNSVSTCTRFPSDCCATCAGFTTPTTTSTTGVSTQMINTSSATTSTSTRSTQRPTATPEKEEEIPDWVIPVAAGAGGILVLISLIGLCTYCFNQRSERGYRSRERRSHSAERYRKRSEDKRRQSEDKRRQSEDKNRRRSQDNIARLNVDYLHADTRRKSEDVRGGGRRNYDRRYSTPNGVNRY